jgi:hypothetical protein
VVRCLFSFAYHLIISQVNFVSPISIGFGAAWLLGGMGSGSFGGAEVWRRLFFEQGIFLSWRVECGRGWDCGYYFYLIGI